MIHCTYYTKAEGRHVLYQSYNDVRITLLQVEGSPTAVGLSDDESRDFLITVGAEISFIMEEGNALFVRSLGINRIAVTLTAIPWLPAAKAAMVR